MLVFKILFTFTSYIHIHFQQLNLSFVGFYELTIQVTLKVGSNPKMITKTVPKFCQKKTKAKNFVITNNVHRCKYLNSRCRFALIYCHFLCSNMHQLSRQEIRDCCFSKFCQYVLECEKESKELEKKSRKNSCPGRLVSTEIKSEFQKLMII